MPQGGSIKKLTSKHPAHNQKQKKHKLGTGKAITKRKRAPEKKKHKTNFQKCTKEFEKEHMTGLHQTVASKAASQNMNLKVLKTAHQPDAKKKKK
eukprot:CAMPEP_0201489570 /NCGR_PEP_ID=MMETSP0151_2-20130828/22889_1 /ASSEMBLY_ACC=CAM_ASM_000257 /TAXON_ID=200890 /ORGANISM="Paramoeba atlantica, Strain 621/1 / CCAP 1560/9" /LENGTH=94 /DNA_ID=CAMNT_0047875203 /DNA_START=49 /DNA_END=333 /DNA_ORIENTATION=+